MLLLEAQLLRLTWSNGFLYSIWLLLWRGMNLALSLPTWLELF